MAYTNDPTYERWRDKSIIAQVAAKIATDLTVANGGDLNAWTDTLAVVNTGILALAGDQPAPNVQATGAKHGGGSGFQRRERADGELPYGGTTINFGKYKGMTIAEIDAADGDEGDGTGYLDWLATESNNDFIKKAANGYLRAKRQQSNVKQVQEAFEGEEKF